MKIEILKEDIIPYVYFVCSIAYESESGMHGALGSKSDFIGGIFDRWINIIPESIIFNKKILLDVMNKINKDKKIVNNIEVYSDFFKYKPNIVGIAPDVLGVKVNNQIIPFIKYDDRRNKKDFWVPQKDSPQIEVKSFKDTQYLVSLRNQNYDDKYLVMVETNLSVDYLLPFFDKKIFNNEVFIKLEVPKEFIVSNEDKHIEQTKKITKLNKLGTLELLLITTAISFMENSTKCYSGESPRYIKDIRLRKVRVKNKEIDISISECFDKLSNGLSRENIKFKNLFNTNTIKTLDIYLENPENISLIKVNKNNIIVYLNNDAKINDYYLIKGNQYSIDFGVLDRSRASGAIDTESDAGSEYFFDKKLLYFLNDKSDELVHNISKVILERIDENGEN